MEQPKIKIEVGTKASGTYWTDWTPFEVVKVSESGKTVTIREMEAKLISGSDYDGTAEYEYSSNENYPTKTVRFTKRGWRTPCNMRISFGHARAYRDPHF
jgi:hypothetical protein